MQAALDIAHTVLRVLLVIAAAVVVAVAAAACDIAPLHAIEPPQTLPPPDDVDDYAPDYGGAVAGQVAFVLKDDGTISAIDAAGSVLSTFDAPADAVSLAHDDGHHLFALTDTEVVMMIDRDGLVIDRMPLPDWADDVIEHVAIIGGRVAVGGGTSVMFLDAPGAIVRVDEPIAELFSVRGRVAYIARAIRDLVTEERAREGLPPLGDDPDVVEQVHVIDDGGVDRATSSMMVWAADVPGAGYAGAAGSDDALMWSVERYRNNGAWWVDLDVISLPDMFVDVTDDGFTDYSGLVSVAALPPLWVPLDVTVTPRPRVVPQ